jgi:PPOX class probable F420-dependent enzyme
MALTLSTAARRLLESDRVAHLATIDPDGSPQVTCVWVGLDGDDVVFASLPRNRKIENVARDPRVTLSIETDAVNAHGLLEHLILRGTARITEGGAADLLQDLAHTYLGPDVVFPPMDDPPPGYVVHITPERAGGIGDWST